MTIASDSYFILYCAFRYPEGRCSAKQCTKGLLWPLSGATAVLVFIRATKTHLVGGQPGDSYRLVRSVRRDAKVQRKPCSTSAPTSPSPAPSGPTSPVSPRICFPARRHCWPPSSRSLPPPRRLLEPNCDRRGRVSRGLEIAWRNRLTRTAGTNTRPDPCSACQSTKRNSLLASIARRNPARFCSPLPVASAKYARALLASSRVGARP